MAYASFHISSLLDKMSSHDKDYRFMATNDLMTELQKDSIKLDDESERKVIKMLLKLLEDKNGEVQNLAVRCLGPLVSKVKDYQVETIVDTLCHNMISEKEQLRDISSIGLKTVITELPNTDPAMLSNVCKKITSRLTAAISKQEDVSVQLEALDILGDLLIRHGVLLSTFHPSIKDALLPLLKNNRMAVRKRANTAIGHLAISCSNGIFSELVSYLVNELQLSIGAPDMLSRMRRTYVQCICAITRQAGHKVAKFLPQLMPLITSFCQQEEIDDELREHCIHTFELFIRRCPMEVTSYINAIIETCLNYITYDPNYNYDDDDAFDDEIDDEEDDDYSDDDDNSWKVRRSSAKCLEAVVSTRPELLTEFYQTISLPIVARFKERDESVRTDIFNVFISLVKHTRVVTSSISPSLSYGGDQAMDTEDSALSYLSAQVPQVVAALQKHLKEKSIKTRHCCFSLLVQLTTTMPGCLSQHLTLLIPGVQYSLSYHRNNSANMKIDTLNFLHILLIHHEADVILPHIGILAPLVIECVKDPSYKITSDALLVLQDLVKVICSDASNLNNLIQTLYSATLHRLKTADIDQEVKERAITCMGQIMSSAGDRLTDEVPATLELFLERLKNEITRLTTVKSLQLIAESQRVDILPILSRAMPVLANFLRKNQRSLKISTLRCLDRIFRNYSSAISVDMMSSVLEEVPQLINENDLYITQLSIQLLSFMMKLPVAGNAKEMLNQVLPNIYHIVQSPLLHGSALNAVLEFFSILVKNNEIKRARSDSVSFRDVLRALIEPIYPQRSSKQRSPNQPLHKQAYHSTAKCVAALVTSCPCECEHIVRQFMMDVENQKSSDSIRSFALLALGEIGQHVDLAAFERLEMVVMGAFNALNEEVKSSASFSWGRICIGNLQHYLPGMIQRIQEQPKCQYLMLHSLKETISHCSPAALENYMESIWNLLFEHAESPEEGTRNVIAECLGKLTLIDPERFLTKLYGFLSVNSKLVRATIITAIKFTITDQPLAIDPLLKEHFAKFLSLLEDKDLNVKRVTLTMLNSAAHNKSILIRDLLPEVLPKLYNETRIREELIREVMMGPFRHTVDDGLDVRKAAYECMYTLLESSVTQLDIFEFLTYVENGLKDSSYDIKMLTSLMLIRLAHLCPTAVLQHVDRLVEPLRTTCAVKVKADSVKQEFEKQNELKRSALRVIQALLAIPEADKSPGMSEFLAQIRSSADLSSMFEGVQKDFTAAPVVAVEAMDTS